MRAVKTKRHSCFHHVNLPVISSTSHLKLFQIIACVLVTTMDRICGIAGFNDYELC